MSSKERAPLRLVASRGADVEERVAAALMAVERVDPSSGAVLRAKISEQELALSSFEGGHVQAHVARILTTAVIQLSSIASDTGAATREALAITARLAPLLERLSSQEDQENTNTRLKITQEHEARIKELEASVQLAKSREAMLRASIGVATILASALSGLVTWWITGVATVPGVTP